MFDRVLNTSITWIKNNAFAQFYSIYLLHITKMALELLNSRYLHLTTILLAFFQHCFSFCFENLKIIFQKFWVTALKSRVTEMVAQGSSVKKSVNNFFFENIFFKERLRATAFKVI